MNAPEMRNNALSEPQRACDECGGLFSPGKRSWTKFCKDACRQAHHRKKRLGPEGRLAEIEEQVAKLKKSIEELKASVDRLEKRAA